MKPYFLNNPCEEENVKSVVLVESNMMLLPLAFQQEEEGDFFIFQPHTTQYLSYIYIY